MNKFQLFRILRRHIKLSEKRSVVYEQNRSAKVIVYVMGAFLVVYMIAIAIILALAANEVQTITPYEFLFGLTPFLITVDFLFRFIAQQTPAQLIKPYSLLPIPKYTCVELFVLSSVVTPNNLIWLSITVPYAIMTTLFSEGFFAALGLVLAFQIIVTINSQWYMLVRTLINKSLRWWALPIIVYAAIFSPIAFDRFSLLINTFAKMGEGFVFWHSVSYFCLLLILTVFVEVNKRMQFHFTYLENANVDSVKLKKVSELNAFDRFGDIGEYIKLEIKSVMRNKNVRKTFIFGTVFIILLSVVISFTDIYSDRFSKVFWVVYTFVLYGAISLIKIMCAEGNYIDCLMVHKENIIQLLKAKYYFYSAMLILPFILMLPTVFTCKYTLLALLSMACFVAGPVYCLLMQMAVYNRQTIPLNTKFVSKGSIETNYFQIVAELIAMFAPMVIISLLRIVFSETVTHIILMVVGLSFITLNDLWIKNIYKRLMRRRYANMESFRATR